MNKIITDQIANLNIDINDKPLAKFEDYEPTWKKELNSIKSNIEDLKEKIPTSPTAQGYNRSDLTVLEIITNIFIKFIETYNIKINDYIFWASNHNCKYLDFYPILNYDKPQDLDADGNFSTTPATFVFTG